MDFVSFIFSNAFIILFLPIWVAFLITLNFTVPSFRSKHFTINLTLISTGICVIYSIALLAVILKTGTFFNNDIIEWLKLGNVPISFGFLLDNFSAIFLVIFTVISFLIQLYSYGYMKNDECFHRYFVYLNMINFSYSGFLISTNLVQSYIFLVLTGICIYMVIGFWYKKKSVSDSSRGFLITNSFADSLIFLGIVLLVFFVYYNQNSYSYSLLNFSYLYELGQKIVPYYTELGFSIICGFIVLGILIKSAQFPFQKWFVGTKEAPITATAVICSASIMFSGVYLVSRILPFLNSSPIIINFILFFGILTSFMCAIMSLLQNDIEKILLYIISSQIGLVFSVLSLFSTSSAVFLVVTISISCALLFLLAGIIIATYKNNYDIKYMGGLRKIYPLVAVFYLIGVLSMSGLFFSGMFSKIQAFDILINQKMFFVYFVLLLSSFFISLSCYRSYFLIFEGESEEKLQKYDFQISIKISLWTLCVLVIFLGFFTTTFFNNAFDPVMNSSVSKKGILIFLFVNILALLLTVILFKGNLLKKTLLGHITYKIEKFSDDVIKKAKEYFWAPICKMANFIDTFLIKGSEKIICLLIKIVSVFISKLQNGNVATYLLEGFIGIVITIFFVAFYYFKIKGF